MTNKLLWLFTPGTQTKTHMWTKTQVSNIYLTQQFHGDSIEVKLTPIVKMFPQP